MMLSLMLRHYHSVDHLHCNCLDFRMTWKMTCRSCDRSIRHHWHLSRLLCHWKAFHRYHRRSGGIHFDMLYAFSKYSATRSPTYHPSVRWQGAKRHKVTVKWTLMTVGAIKGVLLSFCLMFICCSCSQLSPRGSTAVCWSPRFLASPRFPRTSSISHLASFHTTEGPGLRVELRLADLFAFGLITKSPSASDQPDNSCFGVYWLNSNPQHSATL